MEFKGSLSFSTITDPGSMPDYVIPQFRKFLQESFLPNLKRLIKLRRIPKLKFFPILKSGPTTVDQMINSSTYSLVWSARIILRSPALGTALKTVSTNMGYPGFFNRLELAAMSDNKLVDIMNPDYWRLFPSGKAFLGKLGFKIEPAGKVRVFAMVDPWTQWLLSPIHQWIFDVLRQISYVDGTFNQLKPIERLQSKYLKIRKYVISSIDLSAATDRLPLSLQIVLLEELLGMVISKDRAASLAEAWGKLLVDRLYEVRLSQDIRSKCNLPTDIPKGLTYSIGQPMGALSSWAMLAITHHAIVQYAAYKSGLRTWFSDYGVLGDDISISGKVGTEYRRLLQLIGVKAGLAKSIISRNKFVVEFAKKFFVDNTRADMIPFKESIATLTSTKLVLEFVRKYDLSLNQILAFLGYGYRSRSWVHTKPLFELSTRLRVLIVWLASPMSPIGKSEEPGKWVSWITMLNWREPIGDISEVTFPKMAAFALELVDKKISRANAALEAYENSISKIAESLDKDSPIMITGHYQPLGWSGPGLGEKSLLSWLRVFDTNFDSEIDVSYSGGLHDLEKDVTSVPEIRPNLDPLISHHWKVYEASEELTYSFEEESSAHALDFVLNWVFEPHPLKDHIPQSYWPEYRKDEREFTDFLEVYKIWEGLSRPLWSEYHKNHAKTDLDIRGLNPIISSTQIEAEKPLVLEVQETIKPVKRFDDFFTSKNPRITFLQELYHNSRRSALLFLSLVLASVLTTELVLFKLDSSTYSQHNVMTPLEEPSGDRRYMSSTYIEDITRDIPIEEHVHPITIFIVCLSLIAFFMIAREWTISGYLKEIELANESIQIMSGEQIRLNNQINHLNSVVREFESSIHQSSLNPTQTLTLQEILTTSQSRIDRLVKALDDVFEDKKILKETIENNYLVLDKYRNEIQITTKAIDELNDAVETLMLRNSQLESLIERSNHSFIEVQNSVNSLNEFALQCPHESLAMFSIRASEVLHNEVVSRTIARSTMPIHWQEVYITSNVRSIINEARFILEEHAPSYIDRIGWLDLPNPFMGG